MTTTRLKITGMTCGHCTSAVRNALLKQSGVHSATVDLGAGTAEVEHDEQNAVLEQLIAAVESEGYTAAVTG